LLDTGVIVALLDRSERHHRACVEAVAEVTGQMITCEPVIAESCYLLRGIPGAAEAIVENVASGTFQIPFQLAAIARPVQRILRKYGARKVDLADACLIQLANELRTGEILTLDRDFEIYRWGRNQPFHLLAPLRGGGDQRKR
jgi:predicted nucleic acid-binding protein